MKRSFLILLALLYSGVALAQAQINPRWRPLDTVGKWDRISEQVYGFVTAECVGDLDADTSAITTVDADSGPSESGSEDVLNVAATAGIVAGDFVVVGRTTAREEVCSIASVSSGVSLTVTECCIINTSDPEGTCVSGTLTYDHTLAQGDDVELTNRIGPLAKWRMYEVSLTSSAVAGVAGEFLQGNVTVTSDKATGLANEVLPAPLLANEKRIVRVHTDNLYISIIPQSDDSVFRACLLGY